MENSFKRAGQNLNFDEKVEANALDLPCASMIHSPVLDLSAGMEEDLDL